MNILILGASYGSLLSTKMLMAGHNVTLVCRQATANLINTEGTVVRLKLKDENEPRLICSVDLEGEVAALTPGQVNPSDFDLVCLAMQEPQYSASGVKELLQRVALARIPCLSIMNMPPLPYLARIPALTNVKLDAAYDAPALWKDFEPGLISLCSPDPQAFRPPEELANFLHVGLPTNFKAAVFENEQHNSMLRQLESDILAIRLDEKEVPVKLKVFDSLFVPMAKWSMLLTGNYRCITETSAISIKDAVHHDIEQSTEIYAWVDSLARKIGADASDQVPFHKYAAAAEKLLKPSSAARAIESGVTQIERVDLLVQIISESMGMQSNTVDTIVRTVNARLVNNAAKVA